MPYKAFIAACKNKQDLTIWAGPKCLGPNCPNCLAYYKVTNNVYHIWIRRDISPDQSINHLSDESKIAQFVQSSSDPSADLSLLSHEYGHYLLKHDGIIKRSTAEECAMEFEIETDAWNQGELFLKTLGFEDWCVFGKYRKLSLNMYYNGLTTLFPVLMERLEIREWSPPQKS